MNGAMNKLSILVVDDDVSARGLLTTILRTLKCEGVYAVPNGDEALLMCKTINVDIVFLDIEMPGKDGFETLEQILMFKPDQHVVMVSAHSTVENIDKSLALGGSGFVVKPYTIAKVSDILKRYQSAKEQTMTS